MYQDERFIDGQEVKSLIMSDQTKVEVGQGVDKIKVVMEYGQMAGVPWFTVWRGNKIICKYNAAHLLCVTL